MLHRAAFGPLASFAAAAGGASPDVQAAPDTPPFTAPDERPCETALAAAGARCLVLAVPEDRAVPARRSIPLNIVVLPAIGERTLPALFDIDGGPGLPDTKTAGFYAGPGSASRNGRDLVLIDQRGTGASNGLHCPELAAVADQPMFPPEAVARCRDRLAAAADLRFYGTEPAVEDLEAVRRALGYDRIDLFGLSYGTTVALRYLARYPSRVRAAVLMGVAPASAMPPRQHAVAGERAIRLLLEDCGHDPGCGAAFPAIERDAERIASQLPRMAGAPPVELFWEKIRTLMYSPAAARRIPWILHRAAAGDLAPYRAATGQNAASSIADGMFLAVTCSESFALMDYEAAVAAARSTRFGDYRLRRQRDACEPWPRARVPADYLRPVAAPASVLLLSGQLDPVTPPEWADEVARALPNARHLVIPHSGHIFDGMSDVDTCLDPLLVEFLRTADLQGIDASCVARMRPPPFMVAETPAP